MNEEEIYRLKETIEKAMADGVLSRAESERIKSIIYVDKKVTTEEAHLWAELQRKVYEGEIVIN